MLLRHHIAQGLTMSALAEKFGILFARREAHPQTTGKKLQLQRESALTEGWHGRAAVVVPGLVALVLALIFWRGMQGTDDLGYAQLAMSALHGGDPFFRLFYAQDFHYGRIGAIAPLAAVFGLLGPSGFSMAFLPLVSTALTASIVAWLARRFWGNAYGLTAGLVFVAIPLTIGLATSFMPEPLATLEMCLSAVLLLIAVDRKTSARLLVFGAGILAGIAYLTTEVGALMLPILLLYLWLNGKGNVRRDIWLVAGFAVVLGGEVLFNAAVHGNALYRFTLGQGYQADSLVQAANSDLAYRLFKAYPALLLYPGMDYAVWGGLLALGGLWGLLRWKQASLFVIWAAAILLFYNFMSPSLRHYIVTPVAARHIAPATAPLAILAGKLLVDVWNRISAFAPRVLSMSLRVLYAGAMALVAGFALVAMYLQTMPNYTQAIAWNARAAAEVLRTDPSVTIISDERTVRDIQFYRQYNPADSYVRFGDLQPTGIPGLGAGQGNPVYVVENGAVLNERQITGQAYGQGISMADADRSGLERLASRPRTQVFTGHFKIRPSWVRLLGNPIGHRLLDSFTYHLGRKMLADDPSLIQTRVFRLQPGSDLGH